MHDSKFKAFCDKQLKHLHPSDQIGSEVCNTENGSQTLTTKQTNSTTWRFFVKNILPKQGSFQKVKLIPLSIFNSVYISYMYQLVLTSK